MFSPYEIISLISSCIAVFLVLTVHEFAHAFVAVKWGDDTPKIHGRYTLNPIAHIDWIGFVMLILAGFGWAKPVPINPYNFKNYKKGFFWTSIAGVLANFILAFLAYPLYLVSVKFLPIESFSFAFFTELFYSIYTLNLCFFVFNLLPIYPLDGFNVLDVLVKKKGKVMAFLREKGNVILIVLLVLGFIADRVEQLWFIDVLSWFMLFATNIIGFPITFVWGLIF